MKLFTAEQIRRWDQFTIEHEPIFSIDLMERAALKCVQWLMNHHFSNCIFHIFCGKGNNGGDGLAIARLLLARGEKVHVYILENGKKGSPDFQQNLQRLHDIPVADIHFLQDSQQFPEIESNHIIIDALFGTGLNKPLEGLPASLVRFLNKRFAIIVSIDVPSGLFIDQSSIGNVVVNAYNTLTFQQTKTAFLVAENENAFGEVHVLDIGLHPAFLLNEKINQQVIDKNLVFSIYRKRSTFTHKGSFGHALLVSGSYGKIGASVLAAQSCLRSGVGLLSCFVPKCGYSILQTAVPEAMTLCDEEENFLAALPDHIEKYNAIGIGPGIGTQAATQQLVSYFLRRYTKPLVIDADGLNCISLNKEWLNILPASSILTPHPKEFERLFGSTSNDFERLNLARRKATELNVIIILKGHHSFIATPGGQGYFNDTGNAGMATGGSGDVLTGILTGLLAQGYPSEQAAILGVYIHGKAGDEAASALSQEAMIASDITVYLSSAFKSLNPS